MTPDDTVRIDKWLWAARFFRTRALASAAVGGGKVHVNGERARASRRVRAGDVLRIQRAGTEYTVHVEGVSERRGPAPEAQRLYRETDDSRARREQAAAERRGGGDAPAPERRPDKRDRRLLIRMRRPRG